MINSKIKARPAFVFALLGGIAVATPSSASLVGARKEWREVNSLHVKFISTTLHTPHYSDVKEVGEAFLEKPGHVRIIVDRYRKLNGPTQWNPMGNGSVVTFDGETAGFLTTHPHSAQYRTSKSADSEKLISNIEPLRGFFSADKGFSNEKSLGVRNWNGKPYEASEVVENNGSDEVHREIYRDSQGWVRRVVTKTSEHGKPVIRDTYLVEAEPNAKVDSKQFAFSPPSNAVKVAESRKFSERLEIGAAAPDIEAVDASGKKVKLSDYRGKPVVLKFFATWCGTCRQSLPQTRRIAEKYKGQAEVLAVAIWDSSEGFQQWNKKPAATYAPIHFVFDSAPQGSDAASRLYGLKSIPAEFVIDKQGQIVASFSGYEGDNDLLENAVLEALKR